MANIKSAKKRVLVNETKAANNKARNSALKTAIKKANAAIKANADDKEAVVNDAIKKTLLISLTRTNCFRQSNSCVTQEFCFFS